MKTFFNIIWWFPYFGWVLALLNAIGGLIWCATIVGMPIGLGMLQMAKFNLAPHTHMLVSKSDLNEVSGNEMNTLWKYFSLVVRILYFPFGLINAIIWGLYIGANYITILGIPNGIALAKAFSTVFNPVNKVCVPLAVGQELQKIKERNQINKHLYRNNTPPQAVPAPSVVPPVMVPPAMVPPAMVPPAISPSGFCHKCGNPLSHDAAFCAKCGTKRISVAEETTLPELTTELEQDTVPEQTHAPESKAECADLFVPSLTEPVVTEETVPVSLPEYEDDEAEQSKKKLLMWGGIGFVALALILVLWFALFNSSGNDADYSHVFLSKTVVYDSPSDYADVEGVLSYGDKVKVLELVGDGEWAKVEYEDETGKKKKGYILDPPLATDSEYRTLNNAGFTHDWMQEAIPVQAHRRAIIDWFCKNPGDTVKSTSNSRKGVCAGTCFKKGDQILVFVAGNPGGRDQIVAYSIQAGGAVRFYAQAEMPEKAKGIKSIDALTGKLRVTLTPKKGKADIPVFLSPEVTEEPTEITAEEIIEEMHTAPPANVEDQYIYQEEPSGDEYSKTYSGTIDGKYAIEMTLTTDGGAYYTGEYFYTKNKTPIQLRGQLTDDYEHLVLEEYVGLNMTGKFEGTLTRNGYSGTWTNADGDKSMPFSVTKK